MECNVLSIIFQLRGLKKHMKNRDIITRRLEKIEGNIEKMYLILQRQGTRDQFEENLQEMRELVSETKMFVDQEPISPNEINPY